MCCWRGLWIGGLFTPSIFAPWIHVIRESPKVGGNKQANGCWQHSGNSLEAPVPVGELDWVGRIAELTRSKSNEPWNSFKSKQMKRMKNSTGDTQPKGRRRGVLAVPTGSMNYCKRRRKFKLAVYTFFFFFFWQAVRRYNILQCIFGDFLGSPVVKMPYSQWCRVHGFIPGQWTKIPSIKIK